jgi:UDP-N-acetyl-2-amino-2-deoxyglucuronate dehydrogenase
VRDVGRFMGREPRFALIGAAGFVARRHLDAMRSVGGLLVAAHDINDSVGIMDSYYPTAAFFLNGDEFAAFLAQPENRVDYLAVCTPSDLHEEHSHLAFAAGADAIVEKPPVLEPAGIERLQAAEKEFGAVVHPVLQLRYHPEIHAFRQAVQRRLRPGRCLEIAASYVTRRGPWYQRSWKNDPQRSGTIVYNLGIHLFDVLTWTFGAPVAPAQEAWIAPDGTHAGGTIHFADAAVRWLLSIRSADHADGSSACRQILIDDEIVADFSADYANLHRALYRDVIAGRGHRIGDAYEPTVLAHNIVQAALGHPLPRPDWA